MNGPRPGCSRPLILAAHPDDEMIGCGVTLSRLRKAGGDACVVIVTDGAKGPDKARPQLSKDQLVAERRRESREAMATLGVEKVVFLDRSELEFKPSQVLEILLDPTFGGRLERGFTADTVYGHLVNDEHPDHVTVGALALLLAQEWRLPLWQFSIAPLIEPPPPDLFIEPTEEERETKKQGLLSYRTQIHVTRDYLDAPECFWRAERH